ncbi:MAG: ammonium transporter [Actinobacteria bacterium]|nr:ammonium transporter [Actinomycetota bacterium]
MGRGVVAAAAAGAVLVATAVPALAQEAEGPTVDDLQVTLDNVYILLSAVLVIFMQAGFALVEAGLTRAKSVANIMMKNLMDFAAGALAFFVVGFAIAFGGGFEGLGAYIGGGGWFLGDGAFAYGNLTAPTFFIFQVAFAATAATIVSGAMAERTKFKSYFVYSIFISAVIYPVVVRWQWGGGWLYQLSTPFHDFAGSTIVHSVGGWAALVGAAVLGPRLGKYGPDGKPRGIPGHNIPFAILGTLILLVGWYGFNPGSWLGAGPEIGEIALTTTLSAAAGAVVAMFTIWAKAGKPDVAMAANGLLAGLVGVTAGTYAMSAVGAVITGAVSGALVVASVFFFDRIKIDDPVGAISVHGVCGAWGTIAVGLFSAKEVEGVVAKGLFYGGGASQLVSQLIGVVAVAAFTMAAAAVLFLGIKATIGLRVPEEEEIAGLDVTEHGMAGYGSERATI